MPIWLEINPRSGVPIYLQLVQGVRRALEVGSLKPGDRLPTVRELASEQMIAPNTISKAYAELQRLGLIESRPGAGTVVPLSAASAVHTQQQEAALERLRALTREALSLGISRHELREVLEAELERLERSTAS